MIEGSIEEVSERLKSWCLQNDRGLARVDWDSVYARQEVVVRLKTSLGSSGISFVEIELPPDEAAEAVTAGLIENLRRVPGAAASITGVEWAFRAGQSRLDTLVALSFKRELLGALPVRQIWWVPSALTERFVLGIPDLDSWFRLRLHLTEIPPRLSDAGGEMLDTGRRTISVVEARALARRFWEGLESARSRNLPEDRIWSELAQPAVDALLSAGLEFEAELILARMPDAKEALERKIRENGAFSEDARALTLSLRLARLLRAGGDLTSARRLQERVLQANGRTVGEYHPDTLSAMANLAFTLFAQCDYAGARRLLEEVFDTRERVLGADHADTLTSAGNLAATLSAQGDLEGARRLQERVLDAMQRVLGDEHPHTLTAANNLAQTLQEQGDLERARRLEENALDASARVLGEEHPNTLAYTTNLALTLAKLGDLAGARRLQERAIDAMTRVLGEEHPDTLTSMNNLAGFLSLTGDREGALRLLRRCLTGRSKMLGENHPQTAATARAVKVLEALPNSGQSLA